jgi:biopolymer transport protein ExbB/TolQ
MLFMRTENVFTSEKLALIACLLLAMIISPVKAQNNADTKQLSKERRKEEKLEASQKKSEKSIDKADRAAEKDAEAAQVREKNLPSHEDHHKLGAHYNVDKGFDFNSSNPK